MKRSWKPWVIFWATAMVVLAVLTWITRTAVSLEKQRRQDAGVAELEERVRLALWRMDSWLMPQVLRENMRESGWYEQIDIVRDPIASGSETGRAKESTRPGADAGRRGNQQLTASNDLVRAYFSLGPSGQFRRILARSRSQGWQNSGGTTPSSDHWRRDLETLLDTPVRIEASHSWMLMPSGQGKGEDSIRFAEALMRAGREHLPKTQEPVVVQAGGPSQWETSRDQRSQAFRNSIELQNRTRLSDEASQAGSMLGADASPSSRTGAIVEPLRPCWLGEELFLFRASTRGGQVFLQGLWVDWPDLQAQLVGLVADILPEARLKPLAGDPALFDSRALALIPVRLEPGLIAAAAGLGDATLLLPLALAWIAVMLSGLVAAWMLRETLALSERRAAFVSAVSHELRTPLTTFKLYCEMLTSGMVAGAEQTSRYLNTLASEASRLSHLVENVLSYARLERGLGRIKAVEMPLRSLVSEIVPRLDELARRGGMELLEGDLKDLCETWVMADLTVVEQVIFNLVDNACKHAAPKAEDRRLHLEFGITGSFATVRVSDHGPGISGSVREKLFEPFNRSADEAAGGAAGVGLGLALSRDLIRRMGGELLWIDSGEPGATFEIRLTICPAKPKA